MNKFTVTKVDNTDDALAIIRQGTPGRGYKIPSQPTVLESLKTVLASFDDQSEWSDRDISRARIAVRMEEALNAELLEALKAMMEFADDGDQEFCSDAVRKGRIAIAKVEGQS